MEFLLACCCGAGESEMMKEAGIVSEESGFRDCGFAEGSTAPLLQRFTL